MVWVANKVWFACLDMAIPEEYTAGRFLLQYYFEVFTSSNQASFFHALTDDLANVPYFLVKTS